MNTFLNGLKKQTNLGLTEKGATTNKSTLSHVYDYFATCGAMRSMDEDEILDMFKLAYREDSELAIKTLFYSRDARGGQGERKTPRIIFKFLGNYLATEDEIYKLMTYIIEYGRWDDIYSLFNTPSEKYALKFIKEQYDVDIKDEYPSLMGKWLKKEKSDKEIGRKIRNALGLTSEEYRKAVSSLRKRINIIERHISSLNYNEIDYSKVPSQAMFRYRKLFYKYDEERFTNYLDEVQEGKKKINTATLVPCQIVKDINNLYSFMPSYEAECSQLISSWDNIPNYLQDSDENILTIVDTSPSMRDAHDSLYNAIALGLYTSLNTKGAFKGHFITFSNVPSLVEIQGEDIIEMTKDIARSEWGNTTNLKAVFELLKNVQELNDIPKDDMPTKLIIVSDMEFDYAVGEECGYYLKEISETEKTTLMHDIKKEYEEAGLVFPEIVFWNVRARNDNFPMTKDDYGTLMVSGNNPMLFESILKGEIVDPIKLMLDVLNSERYANILI